MTTDKEVADTLQPAGSPPTGEPVFLVVGKIHRPHGLKGEVIFEVITDFPERIRPGVTLYVGDKRESVVIEGRRRHGANLLIRFVEFDNPEMLISLTNRFVYVRADDRPPLPEGEFYHHQIIGLSVISDQDQVLGELVKILETGANDVYLVRSESGKEILLPAIPDVIQKIDLPAGKIIVHLIPGLLPD
jgi:16S rRNA processing protein RimM